MPKPQPSEPTEQIMLRPPASLAESARALAAASRDSNGRALTLNRYAVEILRDAVTRGVVIQLEERARFTYDKFSGPPPEAAASRLNDSGEPPMQSGSSGR